jgi:hypothetical protein
MHGLGQQEIIKKKNESSKYKEREICGWIQLAKYRMKCTGLLNRPALQGTPCAWSRLLNLLVR